MSGSFRGGWRATEGRVLSEERQTTRAISDLNDRAAEISKEMAAIEVGLAGGSSGYKTDSEISLVEGDNYQILTVNQTAHTIEYWLRPGINSPDLSAIRLNPSGTRLLTIYGREMRVLEPKRVAPLRVITNVSDAQWISDSKFAAIQTYRSSEVNLFNLQGEQIKTIITFLRDRATVSLTSFAHSGKLTITGNNDGRAFSILVDDGGTLTELPPERHHLFCGAHHLSAELYSTPPKLYLEEKQIPISSLSTQTLSGLACSDTYLLTSLSNTNTLARSIVAFNLDTAGKDTLRLSPTQNVRFLNQSLASPHAVPFVVYAPEMAPQILSYDGRFDKIIRPQLTSVSLVKTDDGHRIPLFRLPASGPVKGAVLIVYGAYGRSIYRGARPELLAVRKRGYDIFIGEVRGGGADIKGKAWAHLGKFSGKERTISDTITVARHLKNTYKNVVGYGTSAGGLIIINAAIQAPEIFSGMLLENPLLDLEAALSDHLAPFAKIEALEWGERAAPHIARLSPMRLDIPGNLPPTALVLGLNDDLIPPAKAYAFAQKIRAAGGVAVIAADRYAGHSGDDTDSAVRESKAKVAALIEWLGQNSHLSSD